MFYYAPATGLITEYTQALTISVAQENFESLGDEFIGRDYVFKMTGPSRYAIRRLQGGIVDNMLYGGYRWPHGALLGQARLTAATVADTSTSLTVDSYLDKYGNQLFFADQLILVMNKLPRSFNKNHQDAITMEAMIIDSAYTPSTTINIDGFGGDPPDGTTKNAFPIGSIVQPLKAFPGSLGLDASNGLLAQLSKNTTLTGLTATSSTPGTIDSVEWTEPTELRDTGTSPGTMAATDVYVLKEGQGITSNGPPTVADFKHAEHFLASLTDQNPTPAGGKQTTGSTTNYFDQSTNALTALSGGETVYIVAVAKTSSDIGSRVFYSEPAISAGITVAS